MPLAQVNTGDQIVATNLDQYYNLLTGLMTDQPVTLANDVTHGHGASLGTGSPTTVAPNVHGDGTNVYVETDGVGTIFLRPSGNGVNTDDTTVNQTGVSTPSLTSAGAVSGTTGTFTGNVQSNSHPVVEGTAAATHAEVYPAQGSVSSVADGAHVSVTLTFARAFAALPAIGGGCQLNLFVGRGVIAFPSSQGTTAVTVAYVNNDGGSRTLSDFSIMAMGA